MTEVPANESLECIELFVNDAVRICNMPHGHLSNAEKVNGMKTALILVQSVIKKSKTIDGLEELRKEAGQPVAGEIPV